MRRPPEAGAGACPWLLSERPLKPSQARTTAEQHPCSGRTAADGGRSKDRHIPEETVTYKNTANFRKPLIRMFFWI